MAGTGNPASRPPIGRLTRCVSSFFTYVAGCAETDPRLLRRTRIFADPGDLELRPRSQSAITDGVICPNLGGMRQIRWGSRHKYFGTPKGTNGSPNSPRRPESTGYPYKFESPALGAPHMGDLTVGRAPRVCCIRHVHYPYPYVDVQSPNITGDSP